MVDLESKIRKQITSALSDFEMIAEGDRVLVAVSGGKDSTILALLLKEIQKRAPFTFSITPVILDQKQPGFQLDKYKNWLLQCGLELSVIEEDTYSIVKEKVEENKTYCGLCSRLRRGVLYTYAKTNNFNKIALGHHRNDINETLLLNLFYSGSLASMPPKLLSDDRENIVIRPLAYVDEKDLVHYAEELDVPVIPCNLCGSQENMSRKRIKNLLRDLEKEIPNIHSSIQKSISNIKLSQLMDQNLFDFKKF